jgi:hypothetical protein
MGGSSTNRDDHVGGRVLHVSTVFGSTFLPHFERETTILPGVVTVYDGVISLCPPLASCPWYPTQGQRDQEGDWADGLSARQTSVPSVPIPSSFRAGLVWSADERHRSTDPAHPPRRHHPEVRACVFFLRLRPSWSAVSRNEMRTSATLVAQSS